MEEEISRSRKRKIRLVAGAFAGLLIVLTLAGNTLQGLTLPKVYTAQASVGTLDQRFKGTSFLRPALERELTNPAGWKVAKVLVKQGDAVRQGQPLVEYDDSAAQAQLADEQSSLEKLQLSMDSLQYTYIQSVKSGDEAARLSARSAVESLKLDLADQKRHIQKLQEDIAEQRRIVAPFDGIVTDVNAVEGLASAGVPDIRIADAARGYRFELQVPAGVASRMSVGDDVAVQLIGDPNPAAKGKIAAFEQPNPASGGDGQGADVGNDSAATLMVSVALSREGLREGEKVQVDWTLTSGQAGLLVPSAAIHQDNDGYYALTIEERQGPLGNAYYAVRTAIEVLDSNGFLTAVEGGLFEQQTVIVGSKEPILDGMRVRPE